MYLLLYTYLSDDSVDNEHDATPLIKPVSNPDISTTLMATTTTGSNKHGIKWLQHKVVKFFKAFCIPGVMVVRYGMCFLMYVCTYLLMLYHIMIIICDWIWKNLSKSHISFQEVLLKPLWSLMLDCNS